MMSLSLSMKSTGVLLLVLIAISYTAVDAFRWRFPFRRRCLFETVNAVCRVTADPGTVNPVSGIISLTQTKLCGNRFSGVSINLQLQGFSTNDSVVMHGFRALEFGDLSNGCASLGMVFNPSRSIWNPSASPVGEFGNIQEAADGSVNTTITNNVARLCGGRSLIGRGLVITAGNSSTPVGCCVIGRAASPPPVRVWG